MNKRVVIGLISAGVLLASVAGAGGSNQPSKLDAVQSNNGAPVTENIPKKITPICDGTIVVAACSVDDIHYKTYIYHPAVAEKTHTETVTTYREEITGYCTLCSDGTYSPSCATGSGACSHHGGVAQWNAPISNNVPVHTTKTVVDAPAAEEYYDKVTE